MGGASRRSNSTAAASSRSSRRPQSRASTESMQSSHTQGSAQESKNRYSEMPAAHIPYPMNRQDHPAYSTVEAAILNSAHAFRNPHNVPLDPALQGLPNSVENRYQAQNVSDGHYHLANPYEHMPTPELGITSQQTTGAVPSGAETEDRRKKGSASSATNDKELRELIARNDGRLLKDVATEVIATERTPRAEKTKQLFAMLWLKGTCKVAKNSVPRNRVYSHYARRCGTERVVPLNPASFGKLVRVIFPGIQTRRLGVRGESKYHYVDLMLLEEGEENQEPESMQLGLGIENLRPTEANNVHVDFNSMPRLPAETALFPSQDKVSQPPTQFYPTTAPSKGRIFTDPYVSGVTNAGHTSSSYDQILKFPSLEQEPFTENDDIQLPDIHQYCPPRTDIDAADALTALYRTHCTSLVDCIRFCKEKQFFRLFMSFHGTLTVPVQKLFAHPSIAPWIRECDWLMYQKMVRFVSQLTLQVAPAVVLKFFDTISKNLHMHIQRTFQGHALHVLEAKLEPATLFAGLLHRMLRANSAAHAAAALLMIDQTRDQMWHDWVSYVNPKRIMESELPGCGFDEVYTILTHDIRNLLQPLNTPINLENDTHYQDAAFTARLKGLKAGVSTDTVIDRLASFLSLLPMRFPGIETRTLLHCISALGTAALREITVENGLSYQPWWITKVFVDEMSLWLASMGGFLDHRPQYPQNSALLENESLHLEQRLSNSGTSVSNSHSQYDSLAGEFAINGKFIPNVEGNVAPNGTTDVEMHSQSFQHVFDHSNAQNAFDLNLNTGTSEEFQNHDDSGIGMSLIEDDLTQPSSKLGMQPADVSRGTTGQEMIIS